jgi:hypothetical protein
VDNESLYRLTSIARPLEPIYPTNKAVLLLMPAAGILAATIAVLRGGSTLDIFSVGLSAVGAVFGAWALGRELAPDYNAAAFIGMALAFVVALVVPSPSLLLVFLTLFLVRIVNRTVGLPAQVSDSVAVTLLVAWAVYSLENPLLGLVAGAAFGLDALLANPQRRQLGFAAVCLVVSTGWIGQHGVVITHTTTLTVLTKWLVAIVSVGFFVAVFRTSAPRSASDATGELLTRQRVQAGMLIGWLVAVLSLGSGVYTAGFVWAAIAGVPLGRWR